MKKIMNIMAALTATAMCAVPMTSSAVKGTLSLDVNSDGKVDAIDASMILKEYAIISCDKPTTLGNTQKYVADANDDGKVDAIDASQALKIYSMNSIGEEVTPVYISFSATIKDEKGLNSHSFIIDYDEALKLIEERKTNDFYSVYIQKTEVSSDVSVPIAYKTIYREVGKDF